MILSLNPKIEYNNAFSLNVGPSKPENEYDIINKLIGSFNSQISSKNFGSLSQKTNISESKLKKVIEISVDENDIEIKNISGVIFIRINLLVKDPLAIEGLSKNLEYYFNNNPYIQRKLKSDSVYLSSLISQIELKLSDLDKINARISDNNNDQELTLYSNESYITESVRLVSYKEKLKTEIKNLKKVEVVDEFYIPRAKESSFIMHSIISVCVSIVLSFFLIFIIFLNKKAKSYIKTSS